MKIKAVLFFAVMAMSPFVSFAQKDSNSSSFNLGAEFYAVNSNLLNKYNSVTYAYSPYYYYYYGGSEGTITNKSFAAALRADYYLKSKMALRIRIGLQDINLSYSSNSGDVTPNPYPSQDNYEYSTITQKNYFLSLGLHQDLPVTKIVVLQAGADLQYTDIGTVNDEDDANNSSGTNSSTNKTTITTPGGMSIGIGPDIGIDFKIGKHIIAGVEISDMIQYDHIAGNADENDFTTQTNYGVTSSSSSALEYPYKLNGLYNSGVMASVTLMFKL